MVQLHVIHKHDRMRVHTNTHTHTHREVGLGLGYRSMFVFPKLQMYQSVGDRPADMCCSKSLYQEECATPIWFLHPPGFHTGF